jgi:hypothetical protein
VADICSLAPPAENTAEKQRVRQQMLARNWHDDAVSSELGSFCQKSHLIAGLIDLSLKVARGVVRSPSTASLSGVARCWHSNAYFRYFLRYFSSTHRTDLSRFRGTFHSFNPVGFAIFASGRVLFGNEVR